MTELFSWNQGTKILLKNVNDSSEALIHLSEALFSAGVMPYYLHLLDPVDLRVFQ